MIQVSKMSVRTPNLLRRLRSLLLLLGAHAAKAACEPYCDVPCDILQTNAILDSCDTCAAHVACNPMASDFPHARPTPDTAAAVDASGTTRQVEPKHTAAAVDASGTTRQVEPKHTAASTITTKPAHNFSTCAHEPDKCGTHDKLRERYPCGFARLSAADFDGKSPSQIEAMLATPTIIEGLIDSWPAFQTWTDPDQFAKRHGTLKVDGRRLTWMYSDALADQKAGRPTQHAELAEVIDATAREHIIVLDETDRSEQEGELLTALSEDIEVPDFLEAIDGARVLSFGGGHRGVQIMQHGVAWLGLVTGAKLWYVAAPDEDKPADRQCIPDELIDEEANQREKLSTCLLLPGEVIFVPDQWWHATCNLDSYSIGFGAQLWNLEAERFVKRAEGSPPKAATKPAKAAAAPAKTTVASAKPTATSTPPSTPPTQTPAPPSTPPSTPPTPRERKRRTRSNSNPATTPSTPPPSAAPVSSAVSDDPSRLHCGTHMRKLGELSLCPIFNGLWTSFLDEDKYGSMSTPLPAEVAADMAAEMLKYDRLGMNVWIGEDFDARVLSALDAHLDVNERRRLAEADQIKTIYAVIFELFDDDAFAPGNRIFSTFGSAASGWLQLGPPALKVAEKVRAVRDKYFGLIGVEDYTAAQIEEAHRLFGSVATVQQEINIIVRPSAETYEACDKLGCQFVAYGALLGGLLSDKYLFAEEPVPDKAHSKMHDYLASVRAWGDWEQFQELLQVLYIIAETHGASISQVAIAYTLQLPRMLGCIVGLRLGASDHRKDTLAALELKLTEDDIAWIDQSAETGIMLDGLART